MVEAKRILAVVENSAEAGYVLDKVSRLADAENARVQIVRVVYDEAFGLRQMNEYDTQAMKIYVMQGEEQLLVSIVDEYRDRFGDIECFTIWNKRVSDGAIHAAERFSADLIVKAVDTADNVFPRKPDDWQLLRQAGRPVLLVNPHNWSEHPYVLAAVDLLDDDHDGLNKTLLNTGSHVASELAGLLHVVCAYPIMTTWASADINTAIDQAGLERDIIECAQRKIVALTDGQLDQSRFHLRPGKATTVVREIVDQIKPELVVIGTAARAGLQGFFLGNSSEALLGLIESDLLVVPE